MTKCFFLKDLDETPLSGALRWTRTISLAIISHLFTPLELPGQNYCGFFCDRHNESALTVSTLADQLWNIGRAVTMWSQSSHCSITRIPDRLHILLNWDCCSHTLLSWTSKCSIVRTVFSYTAFNACLPILYESLAVNFLKAVRILFRLLRASPHVS